MKSLITAEDSVSSNLTTITEKTVFIHTKPYHKKQASGRKKQ